MVGIFLNKFKCLSTLVLALGLSGCASMRWSDYHKKVLVSSQPQGAKVFLDGKELGVTPLFVNVRRKKKIEFVLLDRSGAEHRVNGKDGVRWIDSFVSGAIFGGAAPVAWGVDWWTGTIWEPKTRVNVILEPTATADPVTRVAFVPLDYDDPVLSVSLAKFITDRVHKDFPNAQLIDFSETAARFEAGGYRWNSRPADEKFNVLVEELGVSHLAEARIEDVGNETLVHIRLRDVHSAETFPVTSLKLKEEKIPVLRRSQFSRFWDKNVSFLPNTFALKAADSSLQAEVAGYQGGVTGNVLPTNSVFGDLSKFLGAASFTTKRGPALPESQRLLLSFTPDLGLGWQKIRFFEHEVQQFDITRMKAYVAFGPQLEWEGRLGVLYLSIRAVGQYSRIEIPGQDFSGFGSGFSSSVGYYKFLTDRWVLQLFADSLPEDHSMWQRAFLASSRSTLELTDVREFVGGISLGYFFPELRHNYFWSRGN